MTIEEMRSRKKELGFTNETLAKASGVPLGTVQKIFAGVTTSPRAGTIRALTDALCLKTPEYETAESAGKSVREPQTVYAASDSREYTAEEFFSLAEETRAELIDGKIVDMSDPGVVHQEILLEIAVQIRECIKKAGTKCRVLLAPFDVQPNLNEDTVVQPDLMIICDMNNLKKYTYLGAPEFVIEILSANSRSRDTVVKLYKYKEAGVREYWIVDPDNETVMVYAFETEKYPKIYMRNAQVPVYISGGKCSVDFKAVFDEVQDLPVK